MDFTRLYQTLTVDFTRLVLNHLFLWIQTDSDIDIFRATLEPLCSIADVCLCLPTELQEVSNWPHLPTPYNNQVFILPSSEQWDENFENQLRFFRSLNLWTVVWWLAVAFLLTLSLCLWCQWWYDFETQVWLRSKALSWRCHQTPVHLLFTVLLISAGAMYSCRPHHFSKVVGWTVC